MKKIILIMSLFSSYSVHADWAETRAGYICDEYNKYFEIYSVITTSTPDPAEISRKNNVPNDRGLFPEGESKFGCSFEKYKISAKLIVTKPQERGQCGGVDHVRLIHFNINESTIFKYTHINDVCWDSLVSLKLKKTIDNLSINYCVAEGWMWGSGYINKKCFETNLEEILHKKVKH